MVILQDKNYGEYLKKTRPTAQFKKIALELLNDRQIHTRREIIEYVNKRGKELGLNDFTPGNASGALDYLLSTSVITKIDKGAYILSSAEQNEADDLLTQAKKVCQNAVTDIQNIARKIDYITADKEDLEQLQKLKQSINSIEDIIDALN